MNGLLAGTALDDITDTYAYKLGRVIRRAERVGTGTTVEVREYSYHLRGWLEEVLVGTVSSCTLATCNCGDEVTCVVGEAYTYDDNGNRETASGSLIPDVVDGDTVYDVQDRQDEYGTAAFEYDDRGQRELRTVGSDETQYVYSPYGELRQVTLPNATVIDYVFDPFGQRVGKKVGGNLEQAWVWGAELNPVAALAADGETFAARYVYGTRSWVPDYIDAGATNYRLITDQLGSVRVVVNTTTGVVQKTYQYDSFGAIIGETGSGYVQPFRFAGGFYDADTGLLRFGARDYDPEIGRWTQKDPILLMGGLNLYAYVDNDPINRVDPTGLVGLHDSPILEASSAGSAGVGGASGRSAGGSSSSGANGTAGCVPDPDECFKDCFEGQGANYTMWVLMAMTPFAPTPKIFPGELRAMGQPGYSMLTTWLSRTSSLLGMKAVNWMRSAGAVGAKAVVVPWSASLGHVAGSTVACVAQCGF